MQFMLCTWYEREIERFFDGVCGFEKRSIFIGSIFFMVKSAKNSAVAGEKGSLILIRDVKCQLKGVFTLVQQ